MNKIGEKMDLIYSKIRLKSSYLLPYQFIGSTIRGAFGVGLKRVVCINPNKECKNCFAKDGCLFYDFFEKDFAKYRFNFELGGLVDFELFLFEESSEKAPYVISALYQAFKEIGIGKKREKIDFTMSFNDEVIYDKEFKNFDNKPLIFNEVTPKNKCTLNIKTPIRVKENNQFVRDDLNLETILRSINHRYQKIKNLPLTPLQFTPNYKIKNKNLSFIDFARYSNRQKTKMKLGGIMGKIEFDYIDENSYKLLKLGEIIGVGKQVTFGLGSINVI